MLAEELINQKIPPLRPADTVEKAAHWFEQLRVGQLPVVAQRQFLGMLREEELGAEMGAELSAESTLASLEPWDDTDAFVFGWQHFYHVMEAAVRHRLHVVPVLNGQYEYLGVVTIADAMAAFGEVSSGMRGEGSILVLTMPERDYSLTQISRYVEEDHAKILSSFTADDASDSERIKLTLRLNTPDPTRIVATLERFGFAVTAQFRDRSPGGPRPEDERLDLLLRYLSV